MLRRRRTDRRAGHPGAPPLPLRELAAPERTGKGVTVAFLDVGFSPHPDLIKPRNRILGYVDVTGEDVALDSPEPSRWLGTMNTVVGAGSGHLSGGVYRSLAPEAQLVLVKVMRRGTVDEDDVARGLEWVLENRQRYAIRVLSLSAGEGDELVWRSPRLDGLAEECARQGIVVVAGAGSSAAANGPHVLTVGGAHDPGHPDEEGIESYAHAEDLQAEGLPKPEVLAPAATVAAPILPGTRTDRRSSALAELARASDDALPRLVQNLEAQAELPPWLSGLSPNEIRVMLEHLAEGEKFANPHYRHLDSASFAAPIVSSIVAQMLEVNPELSPAAVRDILIASADRVVEATTLCQGFGRVNPREAVALAGLPHPGAALSRHAPRVEGRELVFSYGGPGHQVFVAGDFNDWNYWHSPCQPVGDDLFRCRIPVPRRGPLRYKLVVDGRWLEDPANLRCEQDAFGNRNSLVWLV